MLRQVLIPSAENSTINIPAEFYGKEIEVLLYPFYNAKSNQNNNDIDNAFSKYLYNFGNFKFNRDDANDYE